MIATNLFNFHIKKTSTAAKAATGKCFHKIN